MKEREREKREEEMQREREELQIFMYKVHFEVFLSCMIVFILELYLEECPPPVEGGNGHNAHKIT